MVDMFDEKRFIGVPTGFQAFFGRPETGGETLFSPDANVVDIDIIRGNERIAALIPRDTISRTLGPTQKNMKAEEWSSFSRKYPLSNEEADITADQLEYRQAGDNPYVRRTKLDKMRRLAIKYHHENMRRHVRLFEVLCSQSIRTGKQDAILGTTNPNLQYDFRRNALLNITVGTGWNQAGADIIGDIDLACGRVREHGKVEPDFMGLGGQAMDAFIKDATVQALADNRRIELIEVSTNNPVPDKYARFVKAGWKARGRLRTPEGFVLWLFTYLDVYTNSAGAATKYLPDDEAFIASTDARCDRYFGPSNLLPNIPQKEQMMQQFFGFTSDTAPMPMNIKDPGNVILPEMFYCDAYVTGNWEKISIRTRSGPIFATTMTDAFARLDGLIT
jgi:hypothetical protein